MCKQNRYYLDGVLAFDRRKPRGSQVQQPKRRDQCPESVIRWQRAARILAARCHLCPEFCRLSPGARTHRCPVSPAGRAPPGCQAAPACRSVPPVPPEAARKITGGWPRSWSAMTIRRATVYFSPVWAIRSRTCFLNALSSVTLIPAATLPRPLAALRSDRFCRQREPAALVLTAAVGAGHARSAADAPAST